MVNKDNAEFSEAVAKSLAKFGLACGFIPFACGIVHSLGAVPAVSSMGNNISTAAGKAGEILQLGVQTTATAAVVKGSVDLIRGKEAYASR